MYAKDDVKGRYMRKQKREITGIFELDYSCAPFIFHIPYCLGLFSLEEDCQIVRSVQKATDTKGIYHTYSLTLFLLSHHFS